MYSKPKVGHFLAYGQCDLQKLGLVSINEVVFFVTLQNVILLHCSAVWYHWPYADLYLMNFCMNCSNSVIDVWPPNDNSLTPKGKAGMYRTGGWRMRSSNDGV